MAVSTLVRAKRLSSRESSGRGRSFGGCTTCRSRHVKCDEAHPTCLICLNAGISCGGYARSIFFDFEDGVDTGAGRFRRPFYTEKERQAMSEMLIASAPPKTALKKIREIDDLCESSGRTLETDVIRGPFSAFQSMKLRNAELSQSAQDDSVEARHASFQATSQTAILECLDDIVAFSAQTIQVMENHDVSSDHLCWPASMNFFDIDSSFNTSFEFSASVHTHDDSVSASEFSNPVPLLEPLDSSTIPDLSAYLRNAEQDLHIMPSIGDGVPPDAVFLLKHYSSTVIKLLTPFFSQNKTPWHILFIPHVKSCLAALTLGEVVDHASLCTFYGTLAISALSLGGISQSSVWLEQGRQYHQQAREQIKSTLRIAYLRKKSAKYKSILMAFLTMVQISMITGDYDQTECYLLETEKFIRMKGLNRQKSRKVRLLHHCYAYERIVHESLFVNSKNTLHRQHVRKAIESSGADSYSADALSFRLGQWDNLEVEMLRTKGHEESENDLHLQIPGEWSKTLYPEIFGVPEAYLLLLSLVIRLRRERDHAERRDPDIMDLRDFASRAKSLERCIMRVKELTPHAFAKLQPTIAYEVLDNMLEAMQNALAIYFYRQIYDLDASLLQTKVMTIRDCLLRFESLHADEAYGSARLIWPAYVAACEAEDPETQETFARWFEVTSRRSGLQLFAEALAKVNLNRKQSQHSSIKIGS